MEAYQNIFSSTELSLLINLLKLNFNRCSFIFFSADHGHQTSLSNLVGVAPRWVSWVTCFSGLVPFWVKFFYSRLDWFSRVLIFFLVGWIFFFVGQIFFSRVEYASFCPNFLLVGLNFFSWEKSSEPFFAKSQNFVQRCQSFCVLVGK